MSDSDSALEFCYRCRKGPPESKKQLYECTYCSLLWHKRCLAHPFNLVYEREWICPKHHDHLLSSRSRNEEDLKLQEEITTYETADEIMKYGGITYSVPAKSIEDNFLKYSRRFRRYSSQSAFYVDDQNKLARPIANAINGQDINPKSDGLQMLLDAALEIEGQTPEKPNPEEKKYRAIEELVSLIGEDNLLEMLSN